MITTVATSRDHSQRRFAKAPRLPDQPGHGRRTRRTRPGGADGRGQPGARRDVSFTSGGSGCESLRRVRPALVGRLMVFDRGTGHLRQHSATSRGVEFYFALLIPNRED